MKNQQIIRAYDTINPTRQQKEKMLEAIQAQSAAGKNGSSAQKRLYTAAPTRTGKRELFAGLAACAVVLILSGLALKQLRAKPSAPELTAPVSTQSTEAQVQPAVNVSYVPLLDRYRTALEEGWTREQCQTEGISTRFYQPEPVDFAVGKRIQDINGDGRAELLIGHGENIWDVYTTLEDGTPIQLLSDEQDGWQYYLCQDGSLAAEYYSKEDCFAEYYRLEGHRLVMQAQFQYLDGQWMCETGEQEWVELDEQTARAMMGKYEYVTPDWLPLDISQDIPEPTQATASDADPYSFEAPEGYGQVMALYRSAVSEKWEITQCLQYNLSLMVGRQLEENMPVGFAVRDLDGNGVPELIVTDGRKILDLYTLGDAGEPVNLLSATERSGYFLTEEGLIKFDGSGGAMVHSYVVYRVQNTQLRVVEGYLFDASVDPENPWFHYDGVSTGAPCTQADAEGAIDRYEEAAIPFASFV